MASNSEANLPSDFDIDEVINCWGEHINSSKDIGFELQQLGLPNDVKTSPNTTANHPSLPAAVVSSQQTKIPVTQNTSQSLFVTPSNATPVRSQKSHGFPSRQSVVSPPAPAFPSESLDIPPISLAPSSNSSLLRFSSNLVQNTRLPGQIHVQPLQNVQSTASLLPESVARFPDHAMDDSDDFIEGPLDKIVDELIDRDEIMKTINFTGTPISSGVSSLSSSIVTNPVATIQTGKTQNLQKLPQHTPSQFTLQSPGTSSLNLVRTNTMIGQSSGVGLPAHVNSIQQKATSAQTATADIEELLKIQESVQSSTSKVEQNQFVSHQAKSAAAPNSLLDHPLVTWTTNTQVSDGLAGSISLPPSLLQDQTRFGSTNTTSNKTQSTSTGVPLKLAFVTSPSSNSSNKFASPISSQDSNIQRNSVPHGFSSVSIGKPGVPRTTNQTNELRNMSVLIQPLSPGLIPKSSLNVGKLDKNILHSQLMASKSTAPLTKPNLSQGAMTSNTSQPSNFSVFTMASTSTSMQPTQLQIQKPVETPALHTTLSTSSSTSNQIKSSLASAQSIATTALKITSPSANILTEFQQSIGGMSPSLSSQLRVFSQTSHLLTANTNSQSVTSPMSNMPVFSKYQLNQSKVTGTITNTSNSSPMVFTLAPGTQGAATTLRTLPLITKDKLAGRQIFVLQQPGQVVKKPNVPNIVFVNEGSVPQLVSGPQKLSVQSSSPASVNNQIPVQTISTIFPSSTVKNSQPSPIPVHDSPEGSPSSINSADSDTVPIAVLKQTEALKKKEDTDVVEKKKKKGTKRKKDPNKPVKPLSSFQKFFQKTQVAIRQQVPTASFADVSKIAKQMWENLGTKEKKVYQDEWRTEREQYKKALEEYKAGLEENEMDGPSPKQLKNGQSCTSPIPVSPVDVPSTENVYPPIVASAPSPVQAINPTPATITAAPHGSGKPLAMMKTKMASAQSSGKLLGASKASSSKNKGSSNGIDDGSTLNIKKKPKINPIPKKPCVRENCAKLSKTTKERGGLFCSDECVMLHCRSVFKSWVEARRMTSKAAS